MSKDNKHTQGSPGDFEDKIDAAMAGLEVDLDEEFHGADFYEDADADPEEGFDSWEDEEEEPDLEEAAAEDSEEEYPEEEEYETEESDEEFDSHEDAASDEEEDDDSEEESEEAYDSETEEEDEEPEDSQRELQVELIPPHSQQNGRKRRSSENREDTSEKAASGQPTEQTSRQSSGKSSRKSAKPSQKSAPRSARPTKISYVPISDEELDEKIIPIPKKKHKGLKVTGIVAAILAVTAGCAYGAVSYYYSDRFFEGTYINGINCSNKTAYEVEQLIASSVEDYSIEVTARNQEPQTISGSQINYRYMSDGEVLNLLKQQKPYEWVRGFMETRSYTTQENVTFDKSLLQSEVKALNCAQAENQVEPENAYVALEGSEFTIVPETEAL